METHGDITRALAVLKRQGIALLGLAMIVAGGIWAAVALAATEVEFSTVEGDKTVDVADVKQDVKSKKYSINGRPVEITGSSLQKVLTKAGISEDEWSRVFFQGGDIANGEKFVNKLPPVFGIDEDNNVFFVLPKREGEEGEIIEDITFNLYGAIEIEGDASPKQGEKETYTASVVKGGSQKNYDFSWNSTTGETGKERKFEVTFDTSGEVTIRVTAEREGAPVAEGAISTKVKEDKDKDDGDGDGGGSDTGSSGGGTDFGTDFGSTGPSYTPNFSNPDSGGGPSNDSPAPPDPNEEPPIEEDLGVSVTGELLSAVAPLSPSSGEAGSTSEDETEPEPEAVADEAKQVSAPGALIAGGIIVGLLGLGAGREVENVRPRRLLRRPDLSGLRRLSPPWK